METRHVRTTCNRDCPDACGIVAEVVDGRVTKLSGDPEHPVTRGFLCYRTNRYLSRQYDPDRLTVPLLRRGGALVPASWDEALSTIAESLVRVREESGPAAILNYRSGGSLGMTKHLTDLFFERFGPCTIKSGDICSGAGDAAQEADFGDEDAHDLDDLLHAKTIFLWGKNPVVSNVHLVPVLREARARGARVILVDPVHHRGVELADDYVQVRPGGDTALALGIARRLDERGRWDPAAGDYCDHLDDFRAWTRTRDTREWAALADCTPETLHTLADAYADGPSAILVGWGMQRRGGGSATVRTLDALTAVSGNLGVPGGGVSFYFKRRGAFDLSFQRGAEVAPRTIPEARLGPGILDARDPPVRVVWVSCGNPVAMLPDSDAVRRALVSRELTVVVDSHPTDTVECADVVLPTTTLLEDDDLLGAYGHHFLGNVRPVVPPPAGVLTDYEILGRLAPRVGLDDPDFRLPVRAWKERLLGRVAPLGASLAALEAGPVRNPLAPRVFMPERRFPTPSGKVNLIRGGDPSPPNVEPSRPWLLMALATRKAQASQWPDESQQGPPEVTIHPGSAPHLTAGARVRVSSSHASLDAVVRFDPRQRQDVALMDKGGWHRRGRSANALVPARETDAGGGAVYYDTPVAIEPI